MALRDRSIRCFNTLLIDMWADEISDSMSHFVFEVKKQDGTEYPGNSLHGLVCSIQRYLKTQCGKHCRLFNDDFYRKLRSSLVTVMRERSAAGIGAHCRRPKVISLDEENQPWSDKILGEENGKQLVETLLYLFGLHFALRGGKEHRRLRCVNSQIVKSTMVKERNILNILRMFVRPTLVVLTTEKQNQKLLVHMKIPTRRDA